MGKDKKQTISAVRGMKDLLPPESHLFWHIERAARETFGVYGYAEARFPVVEKTELFARAMGRDTDVVQKEMYTFTDRSGDSLTLRPEATAGICRSFVEHKMWGKGPQKFFTIGPMFRHERPQKGRHRQFNQVNVEALGLAEPMIDAEQIVMLTQLLDRLGVRNVEVHVNSLGDDNCRPAYRQALLDYLEDHKGDLCEDCLRRMHSNPLRVLDCKQEACIAVAAKAPIISVHLCDECRDHFEQVEDFLKAAGVKYTVDPRLVRGLDYYTRTTFEALAGGGSDLGAQNAVAGGGRYDNLIGSLGGVPTPATGFAVGIDRLSLLIDPDSIEQKRPDYYLIAMGPQARRQAFHEMTKLREGGLWVEMSPTDSSLSSQMKKADRLGAKRTKIVGESELERRVSIFRDMLTGDQEEIRLLYGGIADDIDSATLSTVHSFSLKHMKQIFDKDFQDADAFSKSVNELWREFYSKAQSGTED